MARLVEAIAKHVLFTIYIIYISCKFKFTLLIEDLDTITALVDLHYCNNIVFKIPKPYAIRQVTTNSIRNF